MFKNFGQCQICLINVFWGRCVGVSYHLPSLLPQRGERDFSRVGGRGGGGQSQSRRSECILPRLPGNGGSYIRAWFSGSGTTHYITKNTQNNTAEVSGENCSLNSRQVKETYISVMLIDSKAKIPCGLVYFAYFCVRSEKSVHVLYSILISNQDRNKVVRCSLFLYTKKICMDLCVLNEEKTNVL